MASMSAPDDSVALALVELGRAIPMPSEKLAGGRIDLRNRRTFDNGTGQSPYDRWMELVANPKAGRSLREALLERLDSESWRTAGIGTESHPGGERYRIAAKVVDRYQTRAFNVMLREYPKLREAMREERRARAGALRSTELLRAVTGRQLD